MTAFATEALAFPATSLERARAGDSDAFAELVFDHQAMVFTLCYNFFGDRAVAEEAAQDVFLQLYRHLSAIDSPSHLVHWLRQVASRRCIDVLRRTRLRPVPLEAAGEVGAWGKTSDPLLDRKLRRLVASLPEMQRLVVTLRYQEDLDPSDICRIVNLPVNTIKSYLHRALQSLRKSLETNHES